MRENLAELKQQTSSELHLIILWENARYKEKEIIEDIKKNLDIVECYEITWSKEKVANNFTRFYGEKLPSGSQKEQDAGIGSFLLVTVIDKNPNYKFVETLRGYENVNTNLFDLKQKYRKLVKNGAIHATNTPQETNHDITLLLGINYEDYLLSHKECFWNGDIKSTNRNLTGTDGWKNLEELFYTLNATTNYVVLRNYDILPASFFSEEHGDIDILTDDYKNICFILNSKPVYDLPHRVHNYTIVNKEKVFFDFRFLGDDYYCYKFEKDILSSRNLNDKNIYIPSNEYSFYSLVYHALVQKRDIAQDYYRKTYNLYCTLGYNKVKINQPFFDLYYEMLLDFMKENGYCFVKPQDSTVFYNQKVLNLTKNIDYIENKYQLSDVKPYLVNKYTGSEYVYYTGYLNNGKKVFIKYGGIGESAKNEFKSMQHLYSINSENFLKPYYYEYNKKHKLLIMEFIEGESLSDYLKNNVLKDDNKKYLQNQLENIAKTLIKAEIMHRDLRPENILVTKDLKLKVIDMQYAVNFISYKEFDFMINNKEHFKFFNTDYAISGYIWDDMYSLDKVCKLIGFKSDFIDSNIGKYRLSLNIKENTKIFQKIFSIKNKYSNEIKRKVITILGIRISFKVKNRRK